MVALGTLYALLCMCCIHSAHCHVVVTSSSRHLKGRGGKKMKKGGGSKGKMMAMMRKPPPTRTRRPSTTKAPAPESRRATYPFLTLVSPDAHTFNPIVGDVCVKLENAEFDTASVNFTINLMNVTSVALDKNMACVNSYAFSDGANSIEVFAKDATGVFQLSISRQIQAGNLSLTTTILDESGSAFTKQNHNHGQAKR
jgi:hypothetical protein